MYGLVEKFWHFWKIKCIFWSLGFCISFFSVHIYEKTSFVLYLPIFDSVCHGFLQDSLRLRLLSNLLTF